MVPRKISNSYYIGVLYLSVILVDLLFKTKPHYNENILRISALCEDLLYITLCEDDVFCTTDIVVLNGLKRIPNQMTYSGSIFSFLQEFLF